MLTKRLMEKKNFSIFCCLTIVHTIPTVYRRRMAGCQPCGERLSDKMSDKTSDTFGTNPPNVEGSTRLPLQPQGRLRGTVGIGPAWCERGAQKKIVVMYTVFDGVIANSTPVTEFVKKDGTKNCQVTLHIQQCDGTPYPAEVAVKATGPLTNYARCVGEKVRVYVACRVYTSVKEGRVHIGNDIYARAIFLLDDQGNPQGVAKGGEQ